MMKVKEESEKAGLRRNIQKTKITASVPITSWQIDGEKLETVTNLIFLRNLYAGQEATVRTGHGNNRLVPNWERSTSMLYIVTLLI